MKNGKILCNYLLLFIEKKRACSENRNACSHSVPYELTDLYSWVKIYFSVLHMPQGSRKVKGTTPECGKRRVHGSAVESEWESSVCWALINGEVRLLPDILAYKNLKSSTVSSWGFAIYAHWSHLTLTFAKLFSHLWNKETELNYLEGPLRLWHLWEEKHRSGKWLKKSMHPSPFSPPPAQKRSRLYPKTGVYVPIADTAHTVLIRELKPCLAGLLLYGLPCMELPFSYCRLPLFSKTTEDKRISTTCLPLTCITMP